MVLRSYHSIYYSLYFAALGTFICGVPVKSSTPSCAIHFDAGNVYHYSYTTDISLNEANDQILKGAHRPVGFKFNSDIKLSVVWKRSYDYLIKLEVEKSSLHSVSRDGATSDLKEVRKYPVFFHWHGDGTVSRVYLPMNEATISANLKKGLISLLQVQTIAGERLEVDASGECQVAYEVIGNKVTKTKSNCRNLEKAGQYYQANKMFDSTRTSVTSTKYEFANDVITDAQAADTQMVILNANKAIDVQALARQTLKLKKVTQGSPTVTADSLEKAVEEVDPAGKLDLVGMLLGTDIDSPSCLIDCISLAKAVDSMKGDLKTAKVATIASSSAFNKLLVLFRQSSKEKIKEILSKNSDILEQLLDIAAASQTDSALEAAIEVLDFKSTTKYQLAERFVMATGFSSHPREKLLRTLLELFKLGTPSKELAESVALALGAVTRTFCQFEKQSTLPIIKEIEAALLAKMESLKDSEGILTVVRALRNARLPATKDVLIKTAESSKVTAVVVSAIQALAALNKDQPCKSITQAMNRIYHQTNKHYDSAARTAALSIILATNPSLQEVRNLVLSTLNQSDFHLATYVLETLNDLSLSKQSFNQKFQQAMQDKKLNNYNTWSPGGKANALTSYLGKSESMSVPYQLFMQNSQAGVMKKSGMQVNLESHDLQQPLLLFSIYAQGLESLMGATGTPAGTQTEDPTAGLALDLMDVLLRPIVFFTGSSELMSAVWNAPSEPVTALAMNIVTQDKKENIHVQNGIVLEHQLSGVASIKISGLLSISLWNQDAHSVITNSAGTVLTGGLSIANNNYLTSNVAVSIEAEAYVDFSSDVNFYVNPPQVCLRMALHPFTMNESWSKTESSKGFPKKVSYKLTRTSPIQGTSYILSKENSRQCTNLLEK